MSGRGHIPGQSPYNSRNGGRPSWHGTPPKRNAQQNFRGNGIPGDEWSEHSAPQVLTHRGSFKGRPRGDISSRRDDHGSKRPTPPPEMMKILTDCRRGSLRNDDVFMNYFLFTLGYALLDALADYLPRGSQDGNTIKLKRSLDLADANHADSPHCPWRAKGGAISNARGAVQSEGAMGEWESVLDPPLKLNHLWDSLLAQLKPETETTSSDKKLLPILQWALIPVIRTNILVSFEIIRYLIRNEILILAPCPDSPLQKDYFACSRRGLDRKGDLDIKSEDPDAIDMEGLLTPEVDSLIDVYQSMYTHSIVRVASAKLQNLLKVDKWPKMSILKYRIENAQLGGSDIDMESRTYDGSNSIGTTTPPILDPVQAKQVQKVVVQQQVQHVAADAKTELENLLDGSTGGNQAQSSTTEEKMGQDLRFLLAESSFRDTSRKRAFKSEGNKTRVSEICIHGTMDACLNFHSRQCIPWGCQKVHFKKIIASHTDEKLGDCSYLDTCRHMEACRYVHYEVEQDDIVREMGVEASTGETDPMSEIESRLISRSEFNAHGVDENASHYIGYVSEGIEMRPAQWINCDITSFDWDKLIPKNLFKVLMLDPPWNIHMDLPYALLSDQKLLNMPIGNIQDNGVCFLWVTGRAMELGRECLSAWGYELVDELVWVKTNQLQRLVRTGRTGHWLNHCKEHCLIGVKGDISDYNLQLDTDVILAEVRETSRKPDEVYRIIERMSPGPYKLEVFGRQHNVRNNWVTVGNQLSETHIHIPEMAEAYEVLRKDSPNLYARNTYQGRKVRIKNH